MTKTSKKVILYLLTPCLIFCFILGIGLFDFNSAFAEQESSSYDIEFTDTVSYFGSEQNVDIAENEQLTMEFDILFSNFYANNFNVGFIISQVTDFETDYVEHSFDNAFAIRGNAAYESEVYPNFCIGASGKNGVIISNSMTGNFAPYTLFESNTSIKVVYQPYISETLKGSLSVYKKGISEDISQYDLAFSVTNIPLLNAPKENVRIFMECSKPDWLSEDFTMTVSNYHIYTQSVKNIPGLGTHKNCKISKAADRTVLSRATLTGTTDGYFSANESFTISPDSVLSMEFSILEGYDELLDRWIGFGYSQSVGTYTYMSGDLFYLAGNARPSIKDNVTPITHGSTNMLDVFSVGYRIKGEFDASKGTFSIYRKKIGDKFYSEPSAVWNIGKNTLPSSLKMILFFQHGINLDLADVVYTLNGVRQNCHYSAGGCTFTTENNRVVNRMVTLSAVKTQNEEASITYAYDRDINVNQDITYEVISGEEYSLKFYNDDITSATSVAISEKRFVKLTYDGNNICIYGKNEGEEFEEILKVNFVGSKYRLAFYLENRTEVSKSVSIDNFTVGSGTDSFVYDFNCGLSEDFTAVSVGNGQVSMDYNYLTITFYTIEGRIIDIQYVEKGNHASIPEGNFENADKVKGELLNIDQSKSIYLVEYGTAFITVKGGTLGDGSNSKLFNLGDEVQLITTVPIGYMFVGWYGDGKLLSNQITYTFSAQTSLDIEALFELLVITIDVNGGKVNGNNTSASVFYGEEVTILADIPQDKEFAGWYISETENLFTYEERFSFIATENLSLTAKSKDKEYTLTLDNALTEDGKHMVKVVNGTCVTVKANNAKAGYEFSHWLVDGVEVQGSAIYEITVNKNLIVNAVFKKIPYSITVEGGWIEGGQTIFYYGDVISVFTENKEGQNFVGWYLGEKKVSEELFYSFTVVGNTTLKAEFKPAGSGCASNINVGGNWMLIIVAGVVAITLMVKTIIIKLKNN